MGMLANGYKSSDDDRVANKVRGDGNRDGTHNTLGLKITVGVRERDCT